MAIHNTVPSICNGCKVTSSSPNSAARRAAAGGDDRELPRDSPARGLGPAPLSAVNPGEHRPTADRRTNGTLNEALTDQNQPALSFSEPRKGTS